MNFKELFKHINLSPYDNVCLTIDLLNFIKVDKNLNLKILSKELINFLKEFFSNKGTVIIPSFNWDFCNSKYYHKRNSKSKVGAFSNIVLEDKSFHRSDHAIYSFLIYGKLKKILLKNNCQDAFSKNSLIGDIIDLKFKHVLITNNLRDGYFAVHHAEQIYGVDYRYIKNFSGKYEDESGITKKRTFSMFVRKDFSDKWNIKFTGQKLNTAICESFEQKLCLNNAYKLFEYKNLKIHSIKMKIANDILISSLRSNDCLIFPRFK